MVILRRSGCLAREPPGPRFKSGRPHHENTLFKLPGKAGGTYTLLIYVEKPLRVAIGRLGVFSFKQGFYAYVGSALNSLKARVERHVRKKGAKFWHIDFLLRREGVYILEVFFSFTKAKFECKVASMVKGEVVVRRFGSSDCKCPTHLFYLGNDFPTARLKVFKAFRRAGLNAQCREVCDNIIVVHSSLTLTPLEVEWLQSLKDIKYQVIRYSLNKPLKYTPFLTQCYMYSSLLVVDERIYDKLKGFLTRKGVLRVVVLGKNCLIKREDPEVLYVFPSVRHLLRVLWY